MDSSAVFIKHSSLRPNAGFTLLEMMLVASGIAILASIPLFVLDQSEQGNSVALSAVLVAHTLSDARDFARGGNGDSAWGASVTQTEVILFRGDSYALRTESLSTKFPSSLDVTGATEIVFAQTTGEPTPTGTVTLHAGQNETTITIGEHGRITY